MTLEERAQTVVNQIFQSDVLIPPDVSRIIVDHLRFARAEALEEAAKIADKISDKYAIGYYGQEVDTADEIASAIRERAKA